MIAWMAFLILVIGTMTLSTSFAAIRSDDVWWIPENVTVSGEKIDVLFYFIFYVTLIVFILTQIAMVYFMIKYRRQDGVKAVYNHGNNRLEIIWTAIPLVFFLCLGFYGNVSWSEWKRQPIPANALQVDIVAQQFGWNMRYTGPDGILGKTDDKLMDGGNIFGVVVDDSNGKDDIKTYNDMVVPVGIPIHLHLRSIDVIHSFYVPEFRLFQDVVPGKKISWTWFQANKTGDFQIACSQLCGSGHYKMYGKLRVVSQEEFAKWLKEHEPQPQTASFPSQTPTVALHP